MDLNKFIDFLHSYSGRHHIEPALVFFGKRKGLSETEISKLRKTGLLLQNACPGLMFRAGNQDGADRSFVQFINPAQLQIVLPYSGHRQKNIPAGACVFPLDKIELPKTALDYFRSVEPGLYNLWKNKIPGQGYNRAIYLLRNLAMVFGFNYNGQKYPQASFGLYYDDLLNPVSGGTGFTKKACTYRGISALNQTHWLKWLSH